MRTRTFKRSAPNLVVALILAAIIVTASLTPANALPTTAMARRAHLDWQRFRAEEIQSGGTAVEYDDAAPPLFALDDTEHARETASSYHAQMNARAQQTVPSSASLSERARHLRAKLAAIRAEKRNRDHQFIDRSDRPQNDDDRQFDGMEAGGSGNRAQDTGRDRDDDDDDDMDTADKVTRNLDSLVVDGFLGYLKGTVQTLGSMVANPKRFLDSTAKALTHPKETIQQVEDQLREPCEDKFKCAGSLAGFATTFALGGYANALGKVGTTASWGSTVAGTSGFVEESRYAALTREERAIEAELRQIASGRALWSPQDELTLMEGVLRAMIAKRSAEQQRE